MEKCSSLFSTAQWTKMGTYRQLFSHFSLIGQGQIETLQKSKNIYLGNVEKPWISVFAQWAKM